MFLAIQIHVQMIIIKTMKIYLLLACILFLGTAHYCSQVGESSIAKFGSCVVTTPPPQLRWSLNITLLVDYEWRGPDEVKYFYMTMNDELIDETCYQGQTIKGKYAKGTSLLVEQLCFNFKPAISKGDKLYVMIFWDKSASEKQIIYLSFTANGEIEESGPVVGQERERIEKLVSKNLVTE